MDASVVIKWVIHEPDRPSARRLLEPDSFLMASDPIGRLAGSRWEASCRPLVA